LRYNEKKRKPERKKIRKSLFEWEMPTGNILNDGNKRHDFSTHILQVDIYGNKDRELKENARERETRTGE
jgi:hypothetical protein